MENLYYYNLGREVPETAKKPIQGGRMNGKTDINPMWRIKKLTEMFGPCGIGWYYKSVKEWTEVYDKSVAAFVKIELYVKVGNEWSMPIQGTGGNMFVELQRSGPYVSDECFKMATTDAISVACKQLGIGADVYWEKDESKYNRQWQENDQQEQQPDQYRQNQSYQGQGRQEQPPGQPQNRQEQPHGQQADAEWQSLMKELARELARTGYGWGAVTKRYKVDSTEALTKLMIKDCISKMKSQPDRKAS